MVAERRRLLHVVLWLYELQLGGGVRYSNWSGEQSRTRWTRSGTAHPFLPATEHVSVRGRRPQGFRQEGGCLDTRNPRKDRACVRVAAIRLRPQQADDR